MSLAVDISFVILFVLTVWFCAIRGFVSPTLQVLRLTVSAIVTAFFGAILASRLEYHLLDAVTEQVTERMTLFPPSLPSWPTVSPPSWPSSSAIPSCSL